MSALPNRVRRSSLTSRLSHSVDYSLAPEGNATHCRECQPLAKTTEPALNSNLPPESAKIKKILHILKTIDERSEGVEKTIIFSQFTTMLDLIEPFLDAHGIKHVRCTYTLTEFSLRLHWSLCASLVWRTLTNFCR